MNRIEEKSHLRELLPLLARLTGGAAIACAPDGTIEDCAGDVGDLATLRDRISRIIRSGGADAPSVSMQTENEAVSALIRFEFGYLILDNVGRLAEAAQYRRIVEESLPHVAQVARGDAVLFDRNGARARVYSPDGNLNLQATGSFTELCRRAMEEGRPSIGQSAMFPGALAVRIPLSPEFGLAFNNKLGATQRNRLIEQVQLNRSTRYHLEDIIGDSSATRNAKSQALGIANSSSTVLIRGETGTGKELFAQSIHNLSPRADRPFVAVNCGALPNHLVESTLFGYVEGAFTGAKKKGAPGIFEQADGGTLFLDEISEMPFDVQASLLRVIQEREVRRVGDEGTKPVDVRLIVSTNKDLEDLVRQGKFRSDLYFRVNVLELVVPPLRRRKEDIPALTYHFLDRFSRILGKKPNDVTPAVMSTLCNYPWPGNVRELQNCIEHIINVLDGQSIGLQHLPHNLLAPSQAANSRDVSAYDAHMAQAERELFRRAISQWGNNRSELAKHLGLNRTTLGRILKRLDLDAGSPQD